MFGSFLSRGLLLTLGSLQFIQAQESTGKPEAPTPKKIEAPISLPKDSSTRARPWGKSGIEPETVADIPALASSVAAYASVEGCQPKSCAILVMNFTLPNGKTSAYGLQLADRLSSELARNDYKLQVIDRALLESFLAKYRIPAQSIHRTIIRSIADELDARFIVFGTTEKFENGVVRLSSKVIDVTGKDWDGYNAIVNLGPLNSGENLEPIDPFPPLPAITSTASGETLQRVGVDGTTSPRCIYCPDPLFSQEAARLNMRGKVDVEAVINSQGGLENIRIVHGLLGGLNETTIATMRSWRFHPALKDDKPVPVLVPITVDFRSSNSEGIAVE
jgi:protein TonB